MAMDEEEMLILIFVGLDDILRKQWALLSWVRYSMLALNGLGSRLEYIRFTTACKRSQMAQESRISRPVRR